jgi:hypothetical protein
MHTSMQFRVRSADGREFGPAPLSMVEQWAREGRIPIDGLLVSADGESVRSVLAEPSLRSILQAPPTVSTGLQRPPSEESAAMSGLIPYKNPPALIDYYFAVAGLIPLLGSLFGLIAIILGVVGLRKRIKDPKVKGLAHAWVAIILGSLTAVGWPILLMRISASSMW